VFILEHCFASKSFAAVREAFSNVCPDMEVANKTINNTLTGGKISGHRKCLSVMSSLSDKTAEMTVVPVSSSASAAATGYGCRNSILPLVLSFCE
jgi:hypothetical protein